MFGDITCVAYKLRLDMLWHIWWLEVDLSYYIRRGVETRVVACYMTITHQVGINMLSTSVESSPLAIGIV